MPEKLKYGCVGTGGIADWKHLAGYSKICDVEIKAICDPNLTAAQKMAEKYSIPEVYKDYTEMLEKTELDFISVCTPNYLHAPVTIEALKRGIHVHCEKPIAMNAIEAQKMVDAKNKYNKKLMVALNNRFTNEAFFVKKYAEAGLFGEIYHAKCGWRRRRGIPSKGGWFTTKKLSGGGPLIDLGVHFLDLAMYFMSFPRAAAVSGATYSKFAENNCRNNWSFGSENDGTYDVEDIAVGFVRFENGATIDLEFSWASNIEKDYAYCELLGTKGGASYRWGELKIFSEILDTNVDIIPDTNYPRNAIDEFEHFIDCIRNDKEPMARPEEAVELMKVIDAIYESAETGKEVRLL